ncbi:MAG: penicillin-binding protein 2 [Puniceicoccales bacterium]|jgi:cell division protein FtsI/penicillin-binding protein 2|nr:penicillin-binding protein 2 [Puniceicoccales bacterium]
MLAVLMAMLAAFSLLAGRLAQLMLFPPEERLLSIRHTRNFFDIREARRGNIYDRSGLALAVTVPAVELGVDPKLLGDRLDEVLEGLAAILQTSVQELRAPIDGRLEKFPRTRWVSLADRIPEPIFQRIGRESWPGVYGHRRFLRIYPQHRSACHVIGFLNRENVACCGVEKFADFFLRGQDGWILSEKDGRRRELRQFRSRGIGEENGCAVHLTIDLAIQRLAEEELERMAREFSPESAVILVSEAESGKLLALACWPSYDPNEFFKTPLDHLRNRAICDCYEPGSVFKIVAASAGLEEGIVHPQTIFHCAEDHFTHGDRRYQLPKDHSAFGDLSLTDVLRRSSNRGSAQIAIRLGPERFYAYVRRFGFGERSGYGFDGEVEGILHPPRLWDGLTITRMPMGHAIAVTPLQTHLAMGILASDGYLLTPQLVEKIVAEFGEGIPASWLGQPIIRRQVLARRTVCQMRAMLHNPADGPIAGCRGFASKTGTAQKIVDGRYVHNRHVASCSGFFPVDRPRFVVTVVVDSPDAVGGVGWGSRYAKPSFRRIVEKMVRMGLL